MLQSTYVKARKAIESLYDCTCNVIEYKEFTNSNYSTSFKEVEVLKEEPCRISYESLFIANNDDGNATKKVISTKLFISPDVIINPGSKISVTKNGIIEDYKSSGKPAKYDTHQEIMLELFDKWS